MSRRPVSAGRRQLGVRRRDDRGFGLVEVTVTLSVLLVVIGLTLGFVVGLQQQQVNVRDTVNGARQAELASEEVVQYLRAATSPSSTTTESPGEAIFPANIGSTVSGGLPAPETVTIDIKYTAGAGSASNGTGSLAVKFVGATKTHSIGTYDVLAPASASPIFSYWEYSTTNPGQLVEMGLNANPKYSVPPACGPLIAAVKVDVSFLAGPAVLPTRGYAADVATTLQTTIYLRNTSTVFGSTTTTSTSTTLPAGGC